MTGEHPDERPGDAELARQAFVTSLAGNIAMVAVVLGVQIALSRRESLTLAVRRLAGIHTRHSRAAQVSHELAGLAYDVCRISHADLTGGTGGTGEP